MNNKPYDRADWFDNKFVQNRTRYRLQSNMGRLTDQLYMEKGTKRRTQKLSHYITLVRTK